MARVLVVDDRPDVRLSLLYMLEASGFDVAEAEDGRQALSRLSSQSFDVILADLSMPVLDGLGLIRIVRERPRPRPVLIAMTGSAHLDSGEALNEAVGVADAVLTKPFTREQLLRAIRTGEPKARERRKDSR